MKTILAILFLSLQLASAQTNVATVSWQNNSINLIGETFTVYTSTNATAWSSHYAGTNSSLTVTNFYAGTNWVYVEAYYGSTGTASTNAPYVAPVSIIVNAPTGIRMTP